MKLHIVLAAIGAIVLGVIVGLILVLSVFFYPKPQATQGTVTHVGPYGVKGSTSFMLAGSDNRFDCGTNEARECSMVKEGDALSITYTKFWSGQLSVNSLQFLNP